jgi:hypothetical protein
MDTINQIIAGIPTRQAVRITERSGHAKGMTGIVMGYNPAYHTFKIGFVDDAGKYNGDCTTVSAIAVEIIETTVTETTTEATTEATVSQIIATAPASRMLARDVVVGDKLPHGGPTVTDIDRYRDGVRVETSDGSAYWWFADRLVTIMLTGPRQKPQSAPQRPAPGFRPLEPIEPASEPYKPADAAFSVDYGNNVKCVHGKTLQRDYCPGCEVAEETPHYFNGVEVRDRNTRKLISRCVECGLPAGNAIHKPER